MDAPYDFEDDYLPPYDPEDIDIPGDMTGDTPGTPIDMPDAIPTDGFMVPPSPDATPAAPTLPLPDTSIGLNVGMRLLLIGSSDSDAYYLSAKLTLDSVGAPYDSVFAGVIPELETLAGGMPLHCTLVSIANYPTGKYGGIIVATLSALDAAVVCYLSLAFK